MGLKFFDSLPSLIAEIERDKASKSSLANRFPIRLIFLNSFRELRQLLSSIADKATIFEIRNILGGKDKWVTWEDVASPISQLQEDTVVVPLSEYARLLTREDFYSIFKALSEIERNSSIRTYIPLVGLWERFNHEFWSAFYRKQEWAPVWKLQTVPEKVTVYYLCFELEEISTVPPNILVIDEIRDWLDIWKKDELRGILCVSETLSRLLQNALPDQTFELQEISDPREYLVHLFDLPMPFEFRQEDMDLWVRLIDDVSIFRTRIQRFENILAIKFNIHSVAIADPRDFLRLYLRCSTNYERWLIKNAVLSSPSHGNSYLRSCLKACSTLSPSELIEKIWLHIFQLCQGTTEKLRVLGRERRELVSEIHGTPGFSGYTIEEKLEHMMKAVRPLRGVKLHLLTGHTFAEKKALVLDNDCESLSGASSELQEVYPELVYYVSWDALVPDNDVPSWLLEYMREYNCSKLSNRKSPKLEQILNEKNRDKSSFSDWYYALPSVPIVPDRAYVWVDGLGAEWFPLLVWLLGKYGADKGKQVTRKELVRVILPSSTSCNQYTSDYVVDRINDLDRYIHSQSSYKYPDNLIDEIEIVKEIAKQIAAHDAARISVISDHGFSFLCTKGFGNIKRLDFAGNEHEGRFIWAQEVDFHDDDYWIVWSVDEGNCRGKRALVALKHVSLGNTPMREVHGGATPEEVVVPYIELETTEAVEYVIEPTEFSVYVSNPRVIFKITPRPSVIPEAFLEDRRLRLLYDKSLDSYVIHLHGCRAGKYTIKLVIGSSEYVLKVTLRGGFTERELF